MKTISKNSYLPIWIGFIYVVICFLPILKSGLYSDDLPNFQFKTYQPKVKNENAIQLALPAIETWKSAGRFTPVSFFWMEFVFKNVSTIKNYKLMIFILNIMTVIIFLIYLRALRVKINYGIWLICFGSVIQYRIEFHDAYTSLNGMYQVLAIFIFASLILHCYYLIKRKMWLLILSAICFVISMLISEVGLLAFFLVPFSAIILKIPFRKFWRSFNLYLILFMSYLAYVFWLRYHVQDKDVYIGLKAGFDLWAMGELLVKQLYATLPLTNLQDKSAIPIVLFHQFTDLKNLLGVIAMFLLGYLAFRSYQLQPKKEEKYFNFAHLFLFGAILVFPALFILPSLKYQQEVRWGVGYLPVYIQNFGTATLFTCLFEYGFHNLKRSGSVYSTVFFIFIVFSTSINFLFNHALINTTSYKISFPAQVLYDSVKEGILKNCDDGSTIILGNDFYYKSPESYHLLFKEITGKDFKVVDAGTNFTMSDSSLCYYLDCKPGKKVVVSLYRLKGSDNQTKVLNKKFERDCNIDVIKEDGI